MWGTIIDITLIAIIIVSAIIGICKGLIDSVLGLVGTGLAVLAGVFGAKFLSNFVNRIFNLETFILGKLEGGAEGTAKFFGGEFSNIDIAKFCVWIVTVIIIFLIVKLAIFIIAKIFESVVANSPSLSGINRVLGMIFGTIKGLIISLGIIGIASLSSEIAGIGKLITDKIAETKVTNFAYKYVDEFVDENVTADKVQEIVDKIVSKAGSNSNEG